MKLRRWPAAPAKSIIACLFLVCEAPILFPLLVGWLITGLVYLGSELVGASSLGSVYRVAIRSRRGRVRAFLPPGVALGGYVLGLTVLGPKANSTFATDFEPFFSTSAQVIATLLVALAIGRVVLGRTITAAALVASLWALVLIALGEVAAVSGLSVRLSSAVYSQAFAITLGAGLAALIAVVLVGWESAQRTMVEQGEAQRAEWDAVRVPGSGR